MRSSIRVLTTMFISVSITYSVLPFANHASQEKERVIERLVNPNEPVKINNLKIKSGLTTIE